MKILVTGGLGYIGSHTVIELIKNNHEVLIADNLINSKIEVQDRMYKITGVKPTFYQIDVTDESDVDRIFSRHKIDGVIHFAGLKAVGESFSKPLDYYYNNVFSTLVLNRICERYGVKKFVFSSSATVYGEQSSPLQEDMELKKAINPYGGSKAMSERILSDTSYANEKFSVCILRYFNPVGAHISGLIGEDPKDYPNNLMPIVTKVARGQLEKLEIYGDDYCTIDGTAIRDYIHVVDLAKGHVKAIERIKEGVNIYNLGTGRGTTVLELVNTFIKVNATNVPYEIVGRRPGDIAISFADTSKAEKELQWKAYLTIEDMVRDAWRFEQKNG